MIKNPFLQCDQTSVCLMQIKKTAGKFSQQVSSSDVIAYSFNFVWMFLTSSADSRYMMQYFRSSVVGLLPLHNFCSLQFYFLLLGDISKAQ